MKLAKASGICLAVLMAITSLGASAVDADRLTQGVTRSTALTPAERGVLTREFVMKWGPYVQRVYNVPVGVWAKRMVPTFAFSDAGNFRKAMTRTTFEGAISELNGTGHRVSDQKIASGSRSILAKTQGDLGMMAAKLGDLRSDLVYTPLAPCRIVDTRIAGGPIAANSSRSFYGEGVASFTSQGGSATDCGGMNNVRATALALNVTAVGFAGTGHAIIYPYNTTMPNSASLNYNAGAFAQNNGIITQIPNPMQVREFTIWTAQQSNYVVDIVGYFAPPQATELDCTQVTADITMSAGSTGTATAACAAGYTVTGGGCNSAGFTSNDGIINAFPNGNGYFCRTANSGASSRTGTAYAQCCRVPGR